MSSPPRGKASEASSSNRAEPLLVVGVGASAGGLAGLERLFSHMLAGSGIAFVVVQHLERHHASMLAELLGRRASIPAVEARDGVRIERDHVYVIGPNTLLAVEHGVLRVRPAEAAGRPASIDTFLRSLAEDRGASAAGIVLSGSGNDGTAGLRAVREGGGLTLVQAPETAQHPGMPQAAIAAGVAGHVLPVEEMPAVLLEHARRLAQRAGGGPQPPGESLDAPLGANLAAICAVLQRQTGHDFASYKEGTLRRRIRRRLQTRRARSAAEYVELLEREPGEVQALLEDLLIGVTEFFRDPDAFAALEERIIPAICSGKGSAAPVRIWVPGCASGEEAYSIAILVREHLAREASRRPVQIFATDIDVEALAEARRGRYPERIAQDVSPERLERFFAREGASYQAAKELREICLFSSHSLIRDPPFSSLDLLSCRNVLIYLEADLQKELVPLFHYALRSGGHLFLGPSEGLAAFPELFETVDKKHRLFRRRDAVPRPAVHFPFSRDRYSAAANAVTTSKEPPMPTPQQKARGAYERMMLDDYTPPSAVVNEHGDIAFQGGRIGQYLQPALGPSATNLLDAVRGSLRIELLAAVNEAVKTQRKVVRDNVVVELDEVTRRLRVTVRPVAGLEAEAGLYAVVIQERGALDETEAREAVDRSPALPALEQLEAELRTTRADLKSALEEVESANEELKSSNEELISTNEELQSANEELQTSTEELQSANEELGTVNAELEQKVEELGAANSDLQNLFASTEVATIFLDRDLNVTRFTPAATALFHLRDSDSGRPLSDFAPRFDGQDLVADAREVLKTLAPVERQVRAARGESWFILRVLPYRTVDNAIAGLVITFVDVSQLKSAQEEVQRYAELLKLSHDGILVWRLRAGIELWNRGAEELYGFAAGEALGRVPRELLQTRFPRPWEELEAELREHGRWEGELVHRKKDGGTVTVSAKVQLLRGNDGVDRLFESCRDITERKAAEARLAYVASFPERNPNPITEVDEHGRVRYANSAALRLFPDLREKGDSHPWLSGSAKVAGSPRGGGAGVSDRVVTAGDRSFLQVLVHVPEEQVVRAYGIEITERRRAEEALDRERTLLASVMQATDAMLVYLDPELNFVWVNAAYADTCKMRPEDMVGKSHFGLYPNEENEAIFRRARDTGEPVFYKDKPFEFPDQPERGVTYWDWSLVPAKDAAGKVRGLVFSLRETTKYKRAELALREGEERLRTLAGNAQDGIVRFDREGRYVYVNPFVLRILGMPAEAILGKTVEELGRNVDTESWEPRLREVIDSGKPLRLDRKSVEGRWFDVQLMPEFRGAEVETVLTISRDITERKQAEEALRESEAALREADRQKNQFLAMLSHELRNPLAPIRNSLFILERAAPGGEQARRAHSVIDRQVAHMTRLVDDLLDVTRISRGKIQLQRESLDFGDIVRRAVEDHRSAFAANNLELSVAIHEGPIGVYGDRTRLAQAIGNLLQNASKFTPAGGKVAVSVDASERAGQAIARVRDTGAGIPPEMLPRLFEPFTQADATLDRSKGGLGLGLALVKGLIEMHGGTVSVTSEGLGKGAEFTIRIPLEAGLAAAVEAREGVRQQGPAQRILVIEDNIDAAESLREVLELGGHKVEVAHSGPEGLRKAREFKPDIVLCDIGLPGMDGYEVARAFRADEALRSIYLVALTGYALPEDVSRAQEAGFDRHLAKPPSPEKLELVLARTPRPWRRNDAP